MDEIKNTLYYIEEAKVKDEYTIALERDGRKQYVLSKYRPKEYAINLLGEEFGNRQTLWILFGFNLGYGVDKLIEKVGEDVRILIIEPNKEFLDKQMELYEAKKRLFNKKNVVIFSGEDFEELRDVVGAQITIDDFNNFKIKSSDIYLRTYNAYFSKVLKIIDETVDRRRVHFNTVAYYRVKCIKNIINNRHKIYKSSDLSIHKNRYKDVPAVIVSAGPSLKKNIKYLKDFKGIIFAIGRTLTPIMELGIRPDFVVSVDPADIIYDTFDKYKEHDIPLITMSNANNKVIEGSKGDIYFLENSSELIGLLGIRVNPTLAVSGSVATLCLSCATYMGCNPIMFIGQDCAYTNDEKHSEISLMKGEHIDNKVNKDIDGYKLIKSYDGGEVYSDSSLILFLRWFEVFIREHNERQYINATEGGAYIEGAQHIPFKEAIEKFCINVDKPIIEHKLISREDDINVDIVLKNTLKQLEKFNKYISESKKSYEKLEWENKADKIIELLKEIEKNDKKIIELKRGKEITQMLMEDIGCAIKSSNDSKEAIDEDKEARRQRMLRLNKETYSYLEIESKKLIEIIQGEIEE